MIYAFIAGTLIAYQIVPKIWRVMVIRHARNIDTNPKEVTG